MHQEHQAIVRKWLEERKLGEVRTSELFDVSGLRKHTGDDKLSARIVLASGRG